MSSRIEWGFRKKGSHFIELLADDKEYIEANAEGFGVATEIVCREVITSDWEVVALTEPKFKVGDRVYYKDDSDCPIATVAHISEAGYLTVDWDDEDPRAVRTGWDVYEFELYSEEG